MKPAPQAAKMAPAIPGRGKRVMSRRSGQVGSVEQKGDAWFGRYRVDVPGCDRRVNKRVRIAPASGPGAINLSEAKRRLMEIIAEAGVNKDVTLRQYEAATLTTTFKQQATLWLDTVPKRKRHPIKPGTVRSWKSALEWINPKIGNLSLSSVNNVAVRDHVVAPMADDGFSPKTISNYVGVVKMVVASAVNDQGEELYPVKWKHDFMDLPDITSQHQPTFTGDEITKIVCGSEGQLSVLFTLLAGSGLRVGEALALQVEDVKDAVVNVRRGLDAGTSVLQSPKTKNGVREVDLHPSLAVVLNSQIANKTGFVFHNEGHSLCQRTILDSLHSVLDSIGVPRCGFHAFRRFRNTFLRKARVPDGLIQFWMGHAGATMTDDYDKVREDADFRRFTAEQVGLGFEPPEAWKPVAPFEPKVNPQLSVVSV